MRTSDVRANNLLQKEREVPEFFPGIECATREPWTRCLELIRKTREFDRKREDARIWLQREQERVLPETVKRMETVISTYAEENDYALILDADSPQSPVLFTADDVTDEVVKLYNETWASDAPSTLKP